MEKVVKLNRFEKFFHNKNVIKAIFIFPLISVIIIALMLKDYVNLHSGAAYIASIRHLFAYVLGIMFINMLANFSALILYYCLYNRLEDIKKRHKKN